MFLHYLHANLQYISSQPPDTTLLTLDNVHVPTHQHLLAAVSPYLASLLAQAGQGTTISLPFTSKVVTMVMQVLVAGGKEEDDTMETDVVEAAGEMGIMCLVEKAKNNVDDEKLSAEIKTTFKSPGTEPETNQKIMLEGDFNNALRMKEEELNFDENHDNVDVKDDKDSILSLSNNSVKKKKKNGDEQSDHNCKICSVDFQSYNQLKCHRRKNSLKSYE